MVEAWLSAYSITMYLVLLFMFQINARRKESQVFAMAAGIDGGVEKLQA